MRTISGTGLLVQKGGKRHELGKNSLGVFRYRDIRRYEAGASGWRFYWFRFRSEDWPDDVNRSFPVEPLFAEQKEMERCFTELNSNQSWECMRAEARFHCLLSGWMLRREVADSGAVYSGEITALLEKGWIHRISVQVLAKEAGMSERSFRDAVHRITGRSPKDYMLKRRMETAMELLQTTTKSVTQVSAELGYDNPFYFSRAFKACYGFPPVQVRRRS